MSFFCSPEQRNDHPHAAKPTEPHCNFKRKSISVKECMNDNMHITKVELRMEEAASNHR